MFGIDTQDLQDLKIVDVKVGTGAEAGSKTAQSLIPALTAKNLLNSRSEQAMLSRAGTAALPA